MGTTRMRSAVTLAILLSLLAVAVPLFAHHGTAIFYDIHKVLILKGTVTSFKYANPHSQLYFDVKDDKGNVVHWAAEMRNPRNLQSFGHSEKELMEKFAPGAQITVTGNPSRAGAPVIEFGKAVLPDGWCLCNHEGGIGSEAPGAPIQGQDDN